MKKRQREGHELITAKQANKLYKKSTAELYRQRIRHLSTNIKAAARNGHSFLYVPVLLGDSKYHLVQAGYTVSDKHDGAAEIRWAGEVPNV